MRLILKDPRHEDRIDIERLRQALSAQFLVLQAMPFSNPAIEGIVDPIKFDDENEFDGLDVDDSDINTGPAVRSPDQDEVLPPERRALILPSTHFPKDHPLRSSELRLRLNQAAGHLAAVREIVAEKSFQYSHVLRSAPTKAVRTRSRAAIAKLNTRLCLFCRMYSRARAALVRLGAADRTLSTFRALSKDDVKASTAIMSPNLSGASSLRLSWIWLSPSGTPDSSPNGLRECE